MKRLLIYLLAVAIAFPCMAQTKKQATRKKAQSTSVAKKRTTRKKKQATTYSDSSIKGLRNQRAGVQRKIKQQEQLLRANKADVKKRLGNLMALGSEIDRHQKAIDTIQNEIAHIDGNIGMLKSQLATLEEQLAERKAKYIKSMRYLAAKRTVQDRLMFIFSAKNFAQMYRRMRFVREYAAYQRSQGEMVKAKQRQIEGKNTELQRVRGQKKALLNYGKQEQAALQGKQAEQEAMVKSLRKQQKTIQNILAEQRKKDAELNARIDRLVAEEMARAEAEAKRKAEAAAEAKRRAEALARMKAEAEAEAKENARRVAEAKDREEKLKAEAREAAKKDEAAREAAERKAREAEADRMAAERKARVDEERSRAEVARESKRATAAAEMDTEDRKLSGSFERNRGRLPMPVSGSYKIVTHFGQYVVPGMKNVRLNSNGINIQGQPGASVRSVFNGVVSAVSDIGGMMMVMVRHGNYISVYCNLSAISVGKGQSVSTGQKLGTIGSDNILQFQLRNWKSALNPESWLRK